MSNREETENTDIPIVVTGGSVILEYTVDHFQDEGSSKGRRRLRTPDANRKIRTIIIRDDGGHEVRRYDVPAHGKFRVDFQY